jgi:hypothetical protein
MKRKKEGHEKSLAEIGFDAHWKDLEQEFSTALSWDFDTMPPYVKRGWEAAAKAIEKAVIERHREEDDELQE